VWIVVYVVTYNLFAQTYQVYTKAALRKKGSTEPVEIATFVIIIIIEHTTTGASLQR